MLNEFKVIEDGINTIQQTNDNIEFAQKAEEIAQQLKNIGDELHRIACKAYSTISEKILGSKDLRCSMTQEEKTIQKAIVTISEFTSK